MSEHDCTICGGIPPTSGKPCVCKGTNKIHVQVQELLILLAQAEQERDAKERHHALCDQVNANALERLRADLAAAEQRERAAVEGLDRAAYALFTLKRTAPDNVREIATVAHQAACVVLDSLNPALQP